MKSNRLKSSVIASLLMLMIVSVSVQAQDRKGPHPSRQGHEQMDKGERGPKKGEHPPIPDMTEEQKEQMKAVHLEVEKAALPLHNQIREKEARLKSLVSATNYDERALNKVLDEIGTLKTSVRKLEVGSLQKVKSILTEDQMLFLYKHMEKQPGPGKGRAGR